MADTYTVKERSRIMSLVHSSNTKPELVIKRAIKGRGFNYQPKVKGKPDFINRRTKIVIYVNGCFWHGCKKCHKIPKTNRAYWANKIKSNTIRDKQNRRYFLGIGYNVINIWEHELKNSSYIKKLKPIFEV